MITITAYGILHGELKADITRDLTNELKDPHFDPDPSFRNLTGYDQVIIDSVLEACDGRALAIAWELAGEVLERAHRFGLPVVVGIFCQGGRHRSVVVANLLATILSEYYDFEYNRVDRDVHLPVAQRTATAP